MYHYERAIIMTIKFALLLSVSAGGLIVLPPKTADADLKSPLFEDIIPLSGSRYANVCFITDSEDCRGNEFETFEKPIMPALCTPLEDETDCDYGRELADNGCGGMRYVCKSCIPLSDESGCDYGTTTASDGCGGTRTVCKECVPLADQTDCEFGTTTVDDGCGGTRRICKNCTPLESDDPANCEHGVENVDDGCGGTRTICKGCTPQTGDDPESCEHGFEVVDDGCGGTVIKCNGCSPKPDVSPSDCICGVENEDDGCGGTHMVCKAGDNNCQGQETPCAEDMVQETCTDCLGKTYYDSCESEDVCTKSADTEWEDSTIFTTGGEYKVREYCTDPDTNRTLYYHAACNHTKTDLSGNTAPCAGYFEGCETGLMASGKTCTCGGKTYYENCLKECNYEDTEESCRSQGLGFERKCYGSRDGKTQIWYGECK